MSRTSGASDALALDLVGRDRRGGTVARDAVVLAGLAAAGALLWLGLPTGLAAVLLVLAVGLAAASPRASVVGAIAALPFAYRTVELAGRRFSLLELAIVVAVVGTSLSAAVSLRRPAGRDRLRSGLRPWPLSLAALGVVIAGTVSVWSVRDAAHLDESLRVYRWTILEPVAFWAVCRWALQGEADRRLAARAFVLTGAATGAAALAATVLGAGDGGSGGVARVQLLYPHPNNLAFFLERAAVLAVGLALAGGGGAAGVAAAVFALGGVVVTASRGAYLAVVVGLAALVWARTFRRRWSTLIVAGAAVGMAVALWAGGRLTDPGGSGDAPTRLPIWRSSVRMILDHPWAGVGLDGFLYQYWRRYVEPAGWPERYTSHPHNLLLDVWVRLGILGLVAFASLAAAVVVAWRRGRRLDPGSASIRVAATAALLAGLVHGLVDNGYFLPDLAVMTWLLIALSAGHAGGATSESS